MSSSKPGMRDAKKSGKRLIVIPHGSQRNRAIRAAIGSFRPYVPCDVTGPPHRGHDDNLAVFQPSPVT
jgi:hypothetical protein